MNRKLVNYNAPATAKINRIRLKLNNSSKGSWGSSINLSDLYGMQTEWWDTRERRVRGNSSDISNISH